MKDEPLWLWWLFLPLLLESEALFFFPATFASTTSTSSSLIYKLWSLRAMKRHRKSPQLKYPMSYGTWDLWSTPQQKFKKQDFLSPPPKKKTTRKHPNPCLVDLGKFIAKVDKGAIAFDLPTIWAKAGWGTSLHVFTSPHLDWRENMRLEVDPKVSSSSKFCCMKFVASGWIKCHIYLKISQQLYVYPLLGTNIYIYIPTNKDMICFVQSMMIFRIPSGKQT